VGARVGFLATHSREDLHQVELSFRHFRLLFWEWPYDFWLDAHVLGSAGVLWGADQEGAVAAVGPSVTLGKGNAPLSLSLGFRPTLLSRYVFGRVHLGRRLQFTSHIGFDLRLGPRLMGEYRFQHMSNATLSGPNPGVDLHMVGLTVRF
jgi:hypothetical protein